MCVCFSPEGRIFFGSDFKNFLLVGEKVKKHWSDQLLLAQLRPDLPSHGSGQVSALADGNLQSAVLRTRKQL